VITEDPSNPWPAMPIRLEPEQQVDLAVLFAPASGSAPGPRQAALEVSYGSELLTVMISGEAGTRMLQATPMTLFSGVNVPVGDIERQTVILTNTGTFPVEITQLSLQGASASDYSYSAPDLSVIDPGGFEFIEVTYAPTATGQSDAMLVVGNNGTGGDVMITLSGMGASTMRGDGAEGSTISRGTGSGSGRSVTLSGLELLSPTPNPAQGSVRIAYTVPSEGSTSVTVYDLRGNEVARLQNGLQERGRHESGMDVTGLSAGVYMVRLVHQGKTLTRSMTVVK